MKTNQDERKILRDLARDYSEVALMDVHAKTIADWKRINGLRPVRPMIMIEQIPWHEMNINDELTLYCQDPLLRKIEWQMRSELYKWRHFPCDMAFYPYLQVAKVYSDTGCGVTSVNSSDDSLHADAQTHIYEDQLADEKALEKLQIPQIRFDAAATADRENLIKELIGDIIPIKMTGISIWAAVWDRIVFWRGATPVLYDLADRPDFLHQLMTRLLEIEMAALDQYEAENLLDANQTTIHCSGAYSDELPGKGFDPDHVKAKNCWVAGAAQIFSEVSPAMHDEFEIEYMKPYYERFGLVNYGCCEPLHRKIDIVRKIKNVRRISISPWADVEMAAQQMGKDFVMARKSSPSFVATDVLDSESIIKETKATLKACLDSQTPCEFILKDITTVRGQPQRLTQWADLVRNVIESF